MIHADECVVCGGAICHLRKALVAPFLARRIWARQPFPVQLVGCRTCGFRFYNPRLEPAEEERLYSGYRAEEYQRMRQASEPWYTAAFNTNLASTAAFVARRRALTAVLAPHLMNRSIRSVLDYGGDRGDLVCGLIEGAKAYVYEISGIPPVEGVTSTDAPARCCPDLVINSNVLEHVGFPRQLLTSIISAAPAGGLVYLEVPCETPFGAARIIRRFVQSGIMSLAHPSLARYLLTPASLYMMHEHVNYFTERSLSALMLACGCTVIASGRYAPEGGADMAWCLGSTGTDCRNQDKAERNTISAC